MDVEIQARRRAIGLPAAIACVVALLGGAAFWYLQRGAPAAPPAPALTAEARQYVTHLKLSDVRVKATENFMKQMVYEIEGNITNTGGRAVRLVEVNCVFHDFSGRVIARERLAIVNAGIGGLKPSEAKAFRLPFDSIPENWNQQMPDLVIAAIAFS
ncbi:MAG: FxLYD domain-containing protein [Bryobacteraceae bacterium]